MLTNTGNSLLDTQDVAIQMLYSFAVFWIKLETLLGRGE
jgi:hypothetical protein